MLYDNPGPQGGTELASWSQEVAPKSLPSLRRPADVLAFLDTLSAEQLAEISRRSYMHDNGFAKIVLLDYPDGSKLRLHVWLAEDAGDEGDIHSHRWSFKSVLLCGEIEQSIFNVTRGGPLNLYEYRSQDHGRVYQMSLVGPAEANLMTRFSMTPGCGYVFRTGAFHSIAVSASVTATIVLTAPPGPDCVHVLRQSAAEAKQTIPHMSVSELREIVNSLRSLHGGA